MRAVLKKSLAVALLGAAATAMFAAPASAHQAGSATAADAAVSAQSIGNCIDVKNITVKKGSNNDYVKEVQCLVNYSMNPTNTPWIAVDGDFGAKTEAKIIKFQKCVNAHNPVPKLAVDGIVGPKTSAWLEKWAGQTDYVC